MTSLTPGPGRRPADEPTHPTPTRPVTPPAPVPAPPKPAPQRGHLPIATECDCGHDDLDQAWHLTPCPRARPLRTPTLGMLIRDLERAAVQMIATASRQYDPASAPGEDGEPYGPSFIDRKLGNVVADCRAIIAELNDLTTIGLPPAGSAVQFAARRTPSACLPGGSSDHLTPTSPGVSGGRTPGLVDAAAPTSGGTDGSRRVPPHPEAGADFTLPKPQPWGDAW